MSDTCLLPLELIYHAIGYLQDDPLALCQCALAHRALLSCARRSLYANIVIVGPQVNAVQKIQLLSNTLRADPNLGTLVRSLTLSHIIMPNSSGPGVGDQGDGLTSEWLPFRSFSGLRELTLHCLELRSPGDLVNIVSALPQLERLVCHTIDAYGSGIGEAAASSAGFPRLQEIVVKHGMWHHPLFAEQLLLNYPMAIQSLRVIDVSFGDTAEALAWVPVMRSAGSRVESLSISMADRSSRMDVRDFPLPVSLTDVIDQYANDHAYVLDYIAHCSGLRYLCLKYHPDRTVREYDSLDFIEAICEVLGRQPPPFPTLEHLELWMADRAERMVSADEESATRLAHTLLARARYPRFRRLTLRIQQQAWVVSVRVWAPGPQDLHLPLADRRARRAAMTQRWRTAFAAFERAGGVELDVDLLHASRKTIRV